LIALVYVRDMRISLPSTTGTRTHDGFKLQGGPKNGPFLNVDNFAMVSGRKAYDMSKVCKFWLE